MKKLTESEIKNIEVDILNYIDGICKKYNLSYNLDYGTLLGAVRHKGFIPWDDDIDISMPREDYEKLIDLIHKDNGRYKILESRITDGYYYEFAKVVDSHTRLIETDVIDLPEMGVWVDVFPRDLTPKPYCIFKYVILFFVVMRIFAVQPKFAVKYNKLMYPLWRIARIIGYKPFLIVSQWLVTSLPMKSKNNIGFLCDIIDGQAIIWDKKIYEILTLGTFEDNKYPIPSDYDTYLKKLYGDYMKLPSKDKQVAHFFEVYWKSKL